MSDQTVRLVWFAMLVLHGLGHAGALGSLAVIAARPDADTGAWTAARSWLLSSLPPGTATLLASGYWIASLVGFLAAALLFWFGSGDTWQSVAIVSSLISVSGIIAFFGTWPPFNTVAALAVDAVVIGALVFAHWTPPAG